MPDHIYTPALSFVHDFWPTIIRHSPKDHGTSIGLPRPYMIPAPTVFNSMFYWDTFMMLLGVIGTPYEYLAVAAADNLTHLMDRFHVIPNGSRFYFTSRSQPPFFTQIIRLAYEVARKSNANEALKHLRRWIAAAVTEHKTVWLGNQYPHERMVHQGLSRYHDINYSHFLASCESGWDHSTRCGGTSSGLEAGRWLDYLPVCLNSILYVRERDLAWAARRLGDEPSAATWENAANQRRVTMQSLMFDPQLEFFFDYNYKNGERDDHPSLAGFYPLWAGLATTSQAASIVSRWLPKFLKVGGLTTSLVRHSDRQWAAPNGWAPLQFLVVSGLDRYGWHREAREIRRRWCDTCAKHFKSHGTMMEKYNVEEPGDPAAEGLYGNVPGFGWTNSIFKVFAQELEAPTKDF